MHVKITDKLLSFIKLTLRQRPKQPAKRIKQPLLHQLTLEVRSQKVRKERARSNVYIF